MKRYVVGIIFDSDMENAWMLLRKAQPFANHYNGVGGHIEPGETPAEAMVREFEEETYLTKSDIFKMDYLVTLQFSDTVELHAYYIILKPEHKKQNLVVEEGHLEWMPVHYLLDVTNPKLAGEGNIPYFVHLARIRESKLIPI
jgi:8-oxo-dGTP diphosphatase